MNIYPAIDLKDGNCVRLLRGDMNESTIFSDSPTTQAKKFINAGAKWLHIVDLNGAFAGKPVNKLAILEILQTVHIPIQLGGGIRNISQIEAWIEAGISRIILGTIALKNPEIVREACRLFPHKIAVGIDAKNKMVAIEGWAETSSILALDLAKQFEDVGVCTIIYTDISRDGAMQGANIAETAELAKAVNIPIILSGGVTNKTDIDDIRKTNIIEGAIIGRALYDGTIKLQDVIT